MNLIISQIKEIWKPSAMLKLYGLKGLRFRFGVGFRV